MQVAIQDAVDFETPDVVMASAGYAARFQSEVGEWFLKVQEETVLSMIKDWPGSSVLDVGGGHGQLTKGLIGAGFQVAVLGSHDICLERIRDFVEAGQCQFKTGSVSHLPFPDKAFDLVISFRMMPHAKDWKHFISELVRVARKAVVIDYAVLRSINILAEKMFWLKKRVEKNTTGFAVYEEEGVVGHFSSLRFKQEKRFAQYFLPMSLHRLLGSVGISKCLEVLPRITGLTGFLGSPVISCFTNSNIRDQKSK